MNRGAVRWSIVVLCLAVALAFAYLTFALSWSGTLRFVPAIMPGVYIAGALNKLLRLPTGGAGIWYLFFSAHVLFWFAIALGIAWAVSALRARWRPRPAGGVS